MKERPILFSAPMVLAILAGRKTQTRRVMKPQPSEEFMPEVARYHPTRVDRRDGEQYPGPEQFGASDGHEDYKCPFGQPGDRLWVKETWKPHCAGPISPEFPLGTCVKYRADGACVKPTTWTHDQGAWCEANEETPRWRPSIFMPRWASRLTLEIMGVDVERLQDIGQSDSEQEGVEAVQHSTGSFTCPVGVFKELWQSIHGAGSWDKNPWVWVIEFRKL